MSKHLERLNNIYWSFSKKYYNTVEEFRKDIEEYNLSYENEKEWRLDELVVDEPKIEMQYMAWVVPEHILPNELMKVHNQQANKELGDHVFYEGTEIERGENGIAILPIYCGS